MSFSTAPFSTLAFSTVVTAYAVASPFSVLIENQDAERVYLLDAQPYDPVGAVVVDVNFSSGMRNPLLDGRLFASRLHTVLNSQVDMFGEGDQRGGSSSAGEIVVLIGDADHDDMLDYAWDGRTVRILMGAEGFDWTEFEAVFNGTAQGITYNHNYMNIVLRDKSELLNVPLQTNVYGGTGGLDGGSDLVGVGKPRAFGAPRSVSPVLVDRANLIYQFHDGAAEAVDYVYDGAKALTPAATPDVADITVPVVAAGEYVTQLSGGYIKIGAEPAKALTADVQGDNTGGYITTAADIAERMVLTSTVLVAGDFDSQSVTDTNTANSGAVGWYGADGTVAEAIAQVLSSIGASYVFDRTGALVFGVMDFTTAIGSIAAADIVRLERLRTPVPSWRRSIGYGRCWTVQGQADLVGTATDAQKNFVSVAHRYATSESASIQTKHPLAPAAVVDTLLTSWFAADAEATRQQTIYGADRSLYQITAKRQQFKYRPGQTIAVNYGRTVDGVFTARFGFPKDCLILGIVENVTNRTTEFKVLA